MPLLLVMMVEIRRLKARLNFEYFLRQLKGEESLDMACACDFLSLNAICRLFNG